MVAGRCVPHAIAAPEGIRGQVGDALPKGDQSANQFTQQDFNKFMQGYRSQYEEISMWVDDNDIEGQLLLQTVSMARSSAVAASLACISNFGCKRGSMTQPA